MARSFRCVCTVAETWWKPTARPAHSRECEVANARAHTSAPFDNPRWYRPGEPVEPIVLGTGVRVMSGDIAYFRVP